MTRIPNILIVDDEEDIRMTLEAALRAEGYRVTTAAFGNDALEMIKKDPPDLMLLDIMMPDIDGYEVCRQVKGNDDTKNIVVVFATALRKTKDKVEGLDIGADDYITKPFNMPELLAKLRVHFRIKDYQSKLENLVDFAHNANALDLDDIATAIKSDFEEFITADRYSVFVVDDENECFRLLAHNHDEDKMDCHDLPFDQSPIMNETRLCKGKVMETRFSASPFSPDVKRRKYSDDFALCLPLKVGSQILGALNLNGNSKGFFDRLDFSLVSLIAEILSASLNNVRQLEKLRKLATTDGLTELLNHRSFHERLHSEFERTRRFGQTLSCVMLDIDLFKQFNDTYGHPTGDTILKEIAVRLKRHLRKIDTVARYGGEEFAMLLPQTSARDTRVVTERIRLDIASRPFQTDKGPLNVTVSMGICDSAMMRFQSGSALLAKADRALYMAKEGGRNQTVIYDPETVS